MTDQMTVYTTDGKWVVHDIGELAEHPGLDITRALVMPHLRPAADFEHVRVLHNGGARDMFVDEFGAVNHLPRNEAATAIYRAATLHRTPDVDPESLPAVYGPAVVFSRMVWF